MKELTEQQVLFKLAAYCSKGERSLFDLHKKMDQWEFPQAKRKEVIDRLIREHFVDEERYCRAFVRDKTLYAKWGILKISNALRMKQISPELIKEIILEQKENGSVEEQLLPLLLAKNKSVKAANDYERRNKLIRFALGRGFVYEDIQKCLKKLSLQTDEE
ncbi:MAG: regulatory protein RecX [Bacteroidales bacterium]|jgi:regulatory protein|nr:regulatory protein RecX [Bacteroidales bacterium]MDD3161440.1 regulatory protein RecX [Bacteroidales bacterium]